MHLPMMRFITNTESGLGHVRRDQALADAWGKRGGQVVYGFRTKFTHDLREIVVIDDYTVSNGVRADIYKSGQFVVLIDDEAKIFDDYASLIINQNLGATSTMYPVTSLCGPTYSMIRDAVKVAPFGDSGGIVNMIGLKRKLNDKDSAKLLAQAQIVISGSGVTAYEALYLGKPLLLEVLAGNQMLTYTNLIAGNYAYQNIPKSLQELLEMNSVEFRVWANKGRLLVDGHGADRIINYLVENFTW